MDQIRRFVKQNLKQNAMYVALIIIIVFFQINTKGVLLQPQNVNNLILQNSYVLVLAMGMMFVIISGYVDLSVGSIVAIIGAIGGWLMVTMKMPTVPAILILLVLGIAIGAFHGVFIAYMRIPPFIVTLAGMLLFRGLTMVILGGRTLTPYPKLYEGISNGFVGDLLKIEGINGTAIIFTALLIIGAAFRVFQRRIQQKKYELEPPRLIWDILKILLSALFIGFIGYSLAKYKGIPVVLVLIGVLFAVYNFIAAKTVLGRRVYAMGGNEKAARLSGINTKRMMFTVYTNMGFMAAIAGIVFSARLNAATPKAGNGFELDAIAACFIGGASASGGIGTVMGAIIGALVMGVINNGMSIMGIGIDWQQAIKGLVLLAAVAFDVLTKESND
ncbi:MAG: sugar ABC transporter permease [Eubacteriales bacterium]|jgi:putative multiple sugar transport system permease protein|nr:sugar ABC transporter permease [Eubacteriales bacterium]